MLPGFLCVLVLYFYYYYCYYYYYYCVLLCVLVLRCLVTMRCRELCLVGMHVKGDGFAFVGRWAQGEDCACTVLFLTGVGAREAAENGVLPCGVYTEDADES